MVHLIDNPEATPDDLMQFVKGPDFPTGAFILGRAGILDAYRTGRGSIKMRARAEIVEEGKSGPRIVVTELPYQGSLSTIAQRIKELVDGRNAVYERRFAPLEYASNPDFNVQSFRTTNVLRWEYRPGSTLFVVWQQARDGAGELSRVRFGRDVRELFRVPATNVLLLKFSYWLNF